MKCSSTGPGSKFSFICPFRLAYIAEKEDSTRRRADMLLQAIHKVSKGRLFLLHYNGG